MPSREWISKNREKYLEHRRRYYQAHKEKWREYEQKKQIAIRKGEQND